MDVPQGPAVAAEAPPPELRSVHKMMRNAKCKTVDAKK